MKRTRSSLAILITLLACCASAALAGNTKVQVCHIPPGNPSNFHTITISSNAVQAHLDHGDHLGACIDICQSNPCANNGTCSSSGGTDFTCSCPPGFTGDFCEISTN